MRILILLALLQFASCSSTSNKTVEAGPSKGSIDEFSWIENSDFNAVREVPFSPRADSFSGEIAKVDSLSKESLARVPEPKLEQFEQVEKTQDVLLVAISSCYRRQFDKGMKIFKDNLRKYKSHPGYWNLMGTCFYLQGKIRKALLSYNKSRDLKKNYAPPINNIGVIYQYQGLEQKALAAYKKASEVGNFSMTPMFNMGQLYLKYNLIDDAKNIYEKLVRRNNFDKDAVNGLATCYLKEGKANAAINLYAGLDTEFKKNPAVGINYSVALFSAGRQKDARTILANVDTSKLNNYESYYNQVLRKIGGTK
ncbi:tetratricopeptide repeat protein [Halobacteriovorax sp. HLS]|uniref:tetratricopeptide repeat protein n=1 Tax=Halobacteriovorax sp. HLS TaxID=2234000 RepID=UPI000FD98232|nr:tetratricopeptide repeat protein [Halobacteriovorax sp. HLS]